MGDGAEGLFRRGERHKRCGIMTDFSTFGEIVIKFGRDKM